MTTKNSIDFEKKSFHEQMKKLNLLPHKYAKIGVGLSALLVVALVVLKFNTGFETTRLILKNLLLITMLVVAISKDKEEDEMTLHLRAQAFVLAFIWGVLYAAAQPFINIMVDFILNGSKEWVPLSVSKVILFMLLIQLSFYHGAKRMR